LSQTCQWCGKPGLIWHENLKLLVNEVTGQKHSQQLCQKPEPQLVRLYDNMNGIICDRKGESIAFDITNEALRQCLNPHIVTAVPKGNYLQVRA